MTIRVTSTIIPQAAHAQLACASIGFVQRNNPNDLHARASSAGFRDLGNNEYAHPDGSWVSMDPNGVVQRGYGMAMFSGIPGAVQTTRVATPAAPANTFQAVSQSSRVAIDNSRPVKPPSFRGYGIAQIGIVDMSNVHSQCPAYGFVNTGSSYVHPDGSWVSFGSGAVTVGWKGYALGELSSHYSRAQGWT
jgi:hypothetical protein